MTLEQKLQLMMGILLAGIVIVLIMLFFLTRLIKEYGAAVKKIPVGEQLPAAPAPQAGIPGEVIAAISAAVYTLYGDSAVRITGVRRAAPQRSAWGFAGLLENTKPF